MEHTLTIEFRLGTLALSEAWNAILPWFVEVHDKPDVRLNYDEIEFDSIVEAIERGQMQSANVSSNDESLATFRDYPTAGIFDLRLFRLPKETPSVELLLDRLPTKDLIFVYR